MHHKTPWVAGRQRRLFWIKFVAAAAALAGLANSARADDAFPHWEFLGPPSAPFDALAVAPSDPDIVYGSYQKLFFASADGGKHWRFLFKASAVVSGGKMAVHPSRAEVVLWGDDLIRSTDGGASWTRPAGDPLGYRVAFSPAEPDVVYAISDWRAVYRSDDAGASWRVSLIAEDAGSLLDLALSPDSAAILYIATDEGFYVSRDGGASFAQPAESA